MAWTRDSTSGVLTHSGTTRDFWNPGTTFPATARFEAVASNRTGQVRIVVYATPDGRTGFECGIDPSNEANVIIRPVALGVAGANLDSDAHGVPAGTPFTIRVEIIGTLITCSIIAAGYAVVSVSYVNTTEPTYTAFTAWGLVSSVNGATVQAGSVAELRAVLGEVSEVLVGVANGDVYAAYDEDDISLIAIGGAGAFSASSDVGLTVLDGVVYGVDGSNARKIDVVARRVYAYGPDDVGTNWNITTTGAPPGAEEVTGAANERRPGTTKARTICAHRGRLFFGGMDDEPHALYATAIGEPQMLLTSEPVEGRAFAQGVGRSAGTAHTILSLNSVNDNVLLIGCTRSIHALIGDPAEGVTEMVEVSSDTGISGLNAVTTSIGGVNIAHSPDAGLLLIPIGQAPVPVSASVLTEYMQFERGRRGEFYVSMVRDTQRHGLHIFLTLRDDDGSVHLWYDERIGSYTPGAGGFFPETYPDAAGPTCAVNWRGRVILGGKTGYLYEYDDAAGDDDGTAITTRMPLSLMNDDGIAGDTILQWCKVELTNESDAVTFKIYGGPTVEAAYGLTTRELLLSRSLSPYSAPLPFRLRSRALVAELSSNTADIFWRLEYVEANTTVGPMLRRGVKTTRATPGAPCTPFVPASPPPPPPPPPPPGPGEEEGSTPPPGPGMPQPFGGGGGGGFGWFWLGDIVRGGSGGGVLSGPVDGSSATISVGGGIFTD